MRKANLWKMLFFALVCSVLLVGCSDENGGDSEKGQKGSDKEIVIAVNENFISMDPHNTGDTNSNSVQSAMLEGLLGFDSDGQITTVLAEDYSVSENALEYTFKLNQGIKFHDGEEFNAEAVKVNIERIMKDESLRLNSRGFNLITSVDILGDYEIKVTLKTPYSAMLTRFSVAKMLSPKLIKENSDDIPKSPVGTGPFKFVEWVQGDHLTVERYDDYWKKGERVKKITYKPVPENGSRIAMLKTGEASVIYPLPAQNLQELEGNKDIIVSKIPSTIARYVSINTMKEPFDDVRIRQAFNYAVDKNAYIKVVNSGFGLPLDSVIPSKTLYYVKQDVYEQNIEKAKELLKEAGFENGFTAEIWGNTNSDTMKGMQFIQQQLKEIGVTVEIKSMEEGTLSDEIFGAQTPEEAKLQMWYVSWSSYASDVTNATKPLFHSESIPPNSANTAYYKNTEVDSWMNEANSTGDATKQAELYEKIQSTIYKDAPWIFLGVDELLVGTRSDIEGIYVDPTGGINVSDANFK
ncbi:glutathione ABC transporter substrate-binding protein [Psychrobacillus vulpis]|uniref:Glutathione-binding protein GsiB n=1 Tax=Psychrobacillus vulpis TaxID=2325572 RepID=A0A544TTP8_9BACI|nr:glutathione ABC transporter substrate-binding protein [Psychrobacillus vulpis]TQR20790.1 glutathione ABC transporter substrate-binding protein [Psychrobacillus vulpis]